MKIERGVAGIGRAYKFRKITEEGHNGGSQHDMDHRTPFEGAQQDSGDRNGKKNESRTSAEGHMT